MGYPMAVNLRRKLPKSATLFIAELNADAVNRFMKETEEMGPVQVASAPREVAEQSVRLPENRPTSLSAQTLLRTGRNHYHASRRQTSVAGIHRYLNWTAEHREGWTRSTLH